MKRLAALLLLAALATPAAAATGPLLLACEDAGQLIVAAEATLRDMREGNATGAMLNAAILADHSGTVAESATAADWPATFIGVIDEVAMLATSIVERAGITDPGDAEGMSGYSAAMTETHSARCGATTAG